LFDIGNTLREARLRRGLDILDCEAETKIRAKYLRAMEEEQFDLMPSPTYVRGFLRTYADFLDLDGRLVLDEYESRFGDYRDLRPASEAVPRVPRDTGRDTRRREPSGRRRDAPHARRRKRRRRTEVQLLWLAVGGVMSVALLIWMGVGNSSSTTAVTPSSAPVTSQPVATPPVTEPDTDATEAPQRRKKTAIVLAGTGANGCWVQVRSRDADGRVVYEGTLSPGSSKTFRISAAIWVNAANPAELDVTIGRKPAVTLGTEGGTWRITPNGVEDA
jgi:cytoskeleton protein RodZ